MDEYYVTPRVRVLCCDMHPPPKLMCVGLCDPLPLYPNAPPPPQCPSPTGLCEHARYVTPSDRLRYALPMQVRGQIDFMRLGVGVGGAYAYSAFMCSMPRVCALCYTSPTCLHPPTIIYRTHTPCLLYLHHLLTRRVKC